MFVCPYCGRVFRPNRWAFCRHMLYKHKVTLRAMEKEILGDVSYTCRPKAEG